MRSSVSPASPTHLQIGLTPHLCCFDLNKLSFSWQFPKAGYQTAYRIMVTQGDHGAVSFDSGWVIDHHNTSVKPNGISAALQPDRLYFWQVAIQYHEPDQTEIKESPFSAPMRFVTAPEIHSITGLCGLVKHACSRSNISPTSFLPAFTKVRLLLSAKFLIPFSLRQFHIHGLYIKA